MNKESRERAKTYKESIYILKYDQLRRMRIDRGLTVEEVATGTGIDIERYKRAERAIKANGEIYLTEAEVKEIYKYFNGFTTLELSPLTFKLILASRYNIDSLLLEQELQEFICLKVQTEEVEELVMQTLTDRQRLIYTQSFILGYTQTEIAKWLNITKQAINKALGVINTKIDLAISLYNTELDKGEILKKLEALGRGKRKRKKKIETTEETSNTGGL